MAKLSKFILFRLWKNFHMQYKRLHHKKRTVVERMFGSTLAVLPFKAWQRYTRETKLQRKDEKINELEEKLRILEQQVLKLSSENRTFARQVMASLHINNVKLQNDHFPPPRTLMNCNSARSKNQKLKLKNLRPPWTIREARSSSNTKPCVSRGLVWWALPH